MPKITTDILKALITITILFNFQPMRNIIILIVVFSYLYGMFIIYREKYIYDKEMDKRNPKPNHRNR